MKGKRKYKKGKRGKGKKSHALFGMDTSKKASIVDTAKKGGLILLAAIASGGAGAALGKHSLLAGIPVALYGIHKGNPYLIAAGIGLTLSNGFQRPGQPPATTQGVDGFDFKQMLDQAKSRVGTYFENFKEKLYLPASGSPSTAGLEGNEEQVTYFVNPYNSSGDLDMSAIDRVQEQIAQMDGGASGLDEVEREF